MKRPLVFAALLGLAIVVTGASNIARAQSAGATVNYPAGTSLVSGPPGSNFSAVDGPLSTLQSGDQSYESVQPSTGTTTGFGYWAQFDAPASVQLGAGSPAPYSAPASAGQWILIGDPSGTLPATVTGAGAVYTYSSASGYQPTTQLQPGQGAWALGGSGGAITVTPLTAAAQPAATATTQPTSIANLQTFTGQGFQIGVPAGWQQDTVPSGAGNSSLSVAGIWESADGNSGMAVFGPEPLPAGVPLNAVRVANIVGSDPKALSALASDAQVSSPPVPITVQGAVSAAQMTLTWTDPQAGPLTATFVIALTNNNFYVLFVASSASAAAQNQPLIQQIIASFQPMS
jgi:hypothetical protein